MWRRPATALFLILLLTVAVSAGGAATSAAPARVEVTAARVAVTRAWAPAPYRGVDTWYAMGLSLSERRIIRLARAMVSDGLAAAGYRLLWLDAGWWSGARDGAGRIIVSRRAWPHGLPWLTAQLHRMGLEAGLYTDLGRRGCGGGGSEGHLQQDVDQFASWGFDALKADFCGALSERLDPRTAYAALARALARDQPRRPIRLAAANAALPARSGYPTVRQSALDAAAWAPASASSWRTGPDLGGPGAVRFSQVLANLDDDAAQLAASTPSHDGDPDYLTPTCRLSSVESRTQLIMWATLGAPLMLSAEPWRMSKEQLSPFMAPGILALDADPARPARRALGDGLEEWRKPDGGAARYLTLLNRTPRSRSLLVDAELAGLPRGSRLHAEDLLSGSRRAGSRFLETLPAHGALALRVTP